MKRGLLLLSLLFIATSCEKKGYSKFSTRYKVYYTCETGVSPFNQLTTPGRFLSVRKSGALLIITDADGESRKEPLSDSNNRTFMFGLSGLIIGTPTFNNDFSEIFAYDLGCPECDAANKRLKFDITGTATCSECGGSWNLNADGTPVNTDGRKLPPLYRYPTKYTNGLLKVSN